MPFENASFIKPPIKFDATYRRKNPAPLFRKNFVLESIPKRSILSICGLGYAYCYVNGKKITSDLFCAPASDYRKTLWYVEYDITKFLLQGENAVAVICGNGWYNEEFTSSWNHNEAEWRDLPKFILSITADGSRILSSDATWKCQSETATVFNALRSGETFDARLYDSRMLELDYDDCHWSTAIVDDSAPLGVFRKCTCEPIREHEILTPKSVIQTAENKFVFDIGQNISGYIRLTATGVCGQEIVIRYAELLDESNSREINHMDRFYKQSDIQTDRFICSGSTVTWSPMFTYHGFRYIEIEGIRSPEEITVKAVFVHQAVNRRTEFECSDESINALFRAGQVSSYSNMFYLISDCPTREKMGWLNDIQMSCQQFCTDFDVRALLKKWLIDIYDAQRADGALPGIVPTPGWGYDWGNGPVSDGAMFEIPYRLYLHSGDATELINSIPYFKRYLDYLKTLEGENGHISYGLDDWAPPHKDSVVPSIFINDVLRIKFYRIYALALELASKSAEAEKNHVNDLVSRAKSHWIDQNGYCIINELTAVSMLLVYGLFDRLEPLKQQLKQRFEELNFHHNCGMVGMRHLPDAFNLCELKEYAMMLVTKDGFPSYRNWLVAGATTLWEKWFLDNSHGSNSRNHHMYSHFMAWIIETVLGIRHDKTDPFAPEFTLSPYYFEHLTYAKGSYRSDSGTVSVYWRKTEGSIILSVSVEGDTAVNYGGQRLNAGTYEFII